MKRLLSILLLIAICFSAGGYYLTYKLKRQRIKHEVFEAIRNGKIDVKLVAIFSTDSFEWEDDHKEIKKEGKMFDLVRAETSNGKTIYYCFADEKENSLNDLYKSLEKKSNSKEVKEFKTLKEYFPVNDEPNVACLPEIAVINSVYCFYLTDNIQEILIPPPLQVIS